MEAVCLLVTEPIQIALSLRGFLLLVYRLCPTLKLLTAFPICRECRSCLSVMAVR